MKTQNSKSLSLYELILLLLVAMNEITTIYVFTKISELDTIFNLLQLFYMLD